MNSMCMSCLKIVLALALEVSRFRVGQVQVYFFTYFPVLNNCLGAVWHEILREFKVAEHSFQVPMPNSPLLLDYLWLAPVFCKSEG